MRHLREVIALALVACSSSAPAPATPAVTSPTPPVDAAVATKLDPEVVAVELFDALGDASAHEAWIQAAPVQLEIGGASFEPTALAPIPVMVIEQHGSLARIALRLDGMRLGAYVPRAYVLSLLDREQVVGAFSGGGGFEPGGDPRDPVGATLRPGARVRRIARQDGWTQVRYVGAIEVTGWVPDDALVETRPEGERRGKQPGSGRPLHLAPGAVIRAKADWVGRELAVLARGGALLDTIKEIDTNWVEVRYADHDVRIHGFVARRLPPGRIHPGNTVEPSAVVPNAKPPDGTCLYAREGGEAIGWLTGAKEVQLEDAGRAGWWSVAIASEWNGIALFVRGRDRDDLETCKPSAP